MYHWQSSQKWYFSRRTRTAPWRSGRWYQCKNISASIRAGQDHGAVEVCRESHASKYFYCRSASYFKGYYAQWLPHPCCSTISCAITFFSREREREQVQLLWKESLNFIKNRVDSKKVDSFMVCRSLRSETSLIRTNMLFLSFRSLSSRRRSLFPLSSSSS